MKPILNTLIGFFLLLSAAANAQSQLELAFSPSSVSGPVGTKDTIDVIALKFNGIVSMQFPVKYNASILQVDNILVPSPSAIPFFAHTPPAGNFGLTVSGRVGVSWNHPNGTPTSAPDNSVLFRIAVTIIGPGTSQIFISAPPTIEVIGSGGTPATFTYPQTTLLPCETATSYAVAPDPRQVKPGSLVCIPVRVNDFNGIVATDHVLNWGSSVLTFSHTQNYGLPGMDCNNFNPANPGRLIVQWTDPSTTGVTLSDCSILYEVCFTASGTAGTTTLVPNGVGLPPGSLASLENAQGANLWGSATGVSAVVTVNSNAPTAIETTWIAPDTLTATMSPVALPIRVKKFKNINEMSFVVTYDPAVVTYQNFTSTLNPPPPGTALLTVATIPGQPNKLRVNFLDPTTVGKTIADDGVLMTLNFSIASGAAPNALSPITIGNLTNPNIPMRVAEGLGDCRFRTPQRQDGYIRNGASSAPAVSLVSKTDVTCFGLNDGTINILVTGGGGTTAPTIDWSHVPGTSNPEDQVGLAPGTYTVTVTGSGGLTASLSVVITQPTAALSVTGVNVTQIPCFQGTNGAISLNTTGGTAPYTYEWSNLPATTGDPEDQTGLSAGQYRLTITDSRGCTFQTQQYNITAPQNPITLSTSNVTNVQCLDGSSGSVQLNVQNATGAVSYAWRNLCGSGAVVSNVQNPNNLPTGCYSVTITDGVGCTSGLTQPININNAPSALTVGQATTTNPACTGQNNGSICLNQPTGGWGNYSIQWSSPSPGSGFCPQNVGVGTYTATVTDGGGCTAVRTATLTAAPAVTISNSMVNNVTCFNQGNGSITVTTNGSFNSIAWSGPSGPAGNGLTISNLGGGQYVATVTYGGSCTSVSTPILVDNPPAILTSSTTTEQTTTQNGSIDLTVMGGVGTYTYAWSTTPQQTTQDLPSVPAGLYTVTITDQRGCQKIETIEVENACIICGAVATTEAACEEDGCVLISVPVGAQGPFTVNWVGPENGTQIFNNTLELAVCNLKAGAYSVTISDLAGQTYTIPVTSTSIAQRPPVVITSTVGEPTLANANGNIQLTANGALALYEWLTPNVPVNLKFSPVLFNLDSGTYCVRVTNQLPGGCSKEFCFTLNRLYPPIACSTTGSNPTCLEALNGGVNLTVSGGDSNFSFAWSNGATTEDLAGLAQGTYSVTVTDGRGITQVCTPTGGQVLTAASQLQVSNVNEISNYNGFQVSGVGVCNGVANAVTLGASGNVSYAWSNGINTQNNNTLCGGAYAVTATDASGCTAVWTGELTQPTAITGASELLSTYNGFGVSCNERCDGVARLAANGGVFPYIVKWPSGRTEQINSLAGSSVEDDLCGGDHTVTITDANGVSVNYTLTVPEPDPIVFSFTDVAPSTLANCNGEIIATTTGTVGLVTYDWRSQFSQGQGERADNLCAEEEVTFTATDANGCTASEVYTVPFPKEDCFKAVPVITPNGDGDNDFFIITCLQDTPNTVEVYDRWNQAVSPQFTNYQNNWDATRNGQPLPEGVYFYVVKFLNDQGQEIVLQGYVNLLR
jgi:gliding motility-associated-like protein